MFFIGYFNETQFIPVQKKARLESAYEEGDESSGDEDSSGGDIDSDTDDDIDFDHESTAAIKRGKISCDRFFSRGIFQVFPSFLIFSIFSISFADRQIKVSLAIAYMRKIR
jgi:hypothetical protein